MKAIRYMDGDVFGIGHVSRCLISRLGSGHLISCTTMFAFGRYLA